MKFKKGVNEPVVILSIAIVLLLIVPGAIAQPSPPQRQAARDVADHVKDAVGEKISGIKEAVQDKISNRKDVARDRKEAVRESVREKRDALNARIANPDQKVVGSLGRAEIEALGRLTPEKAKSRIESLKVVKVNNDFKARPIPAQAALLRKEALQKLKEEEAALKQQYTERLGKLKETKERLRACGNETAAGCATIRSEAIAQAKDAAQKAVERLINHLQKLKEKIMASESVTEQESSDRAAKVDALILEAEAARQKITEATSSEEMNAAIREIQRVTKKARLRSESQAHGLLRAEINGVIHRSEVVEKKIDCVLAGLESQGRDTSGIEAKLSEYGSTISSAKDKLASAKELLQAEEEATIETAKTLIREAKWLVQEAHALLEMIKQAVRELGGEPCAEAQEIAIEGDATVTIPTPPVTP